MNGMVYVYKSMLNKLQNERRNTIIFILFIVMTGALFISRALLSASMIVFILVSFLHSNSKKQVYDFFSTPLLWGMSVLFLIPFISGLWSSDKKEWLDMIRIKLPLLFLPIAFASPFSLINNAVGIIETPRSFTPLSNFLSSFFDNNNLRSLCRL